MVKKKVLIIGGAGFIGFSIAKYLLSSKNYEVTIADIFNPGQEDDDFLEIKSDSSLKIIKDDFSNYDAYKNLESRYDYVYMLASIVGVNKCIEMPHEVIRVNTALIQNTLKWVLESKIGKILFSSSSECYSATTDIFNFKIPTSEEVPLTISDVKHPRFTYALTKMLGESAFLTFGDKYNLPVTIVRYQNIYGPRMGFNHVIPHLVQRFHLKKENPFKIYGSSQTRAFCFISDAVIGTVRAMEYSSTDKEIFHIGSQDEITIETLVKKVGFKMGFQGEYLESKTYPGSVDRRCPDITKSSKLLDFKPIISLDHGLSQTIDWYKAFFEDGKKIFNGGFKPPNQLSYKE